MPPPPPRGDSVLQLIPTCWPSVALLPASGVVDPECVQSLQHCVGTPQIPVLAPFGHSVKDCVKGEEHCQKNTTATACYILL